jgi:alpha-amylase
MKVGASITGLLPGTPWVYYGEEIGLKGTRVTSPDDQSDVRRRLPMVWDSGDKTGECRFPEASRQDLNNNVQVSKGAMNLLAEPLSLVNHYRKIGEIRNSHQETFRNGVFKAIDLGKRRLVAYELSSSQENLVVVTMTGSANVEVDVSKVASSILEKINVSDAEPSLESGVLKLGAFSTVVLKAK